MTDPPPIPGQVIPPEIKAQYDSLRSVFDTKSSLDRLDSYGKWLFGSSAIIASLGAGFSNAALPKLHGSGVALFLTAILLLGVALWCAAASLAPDWVPVRFSDLDNMRKAARDAFARRGKYLNVAAGCFGLAIICAALAPAVSFLFRPIGSATLKYVADDKGGSATIDATGLPAGTAVSVHLDQSNVTLGQMEAATTADDAGQATVVLKITQPRATGVIVGCVARGSDKNCLIERRIVLSGK
jgi:hypothetical protein